MMDKERSKSCSASQILAAQDFARKLLQPIDQIAIYR
jgi:hypothetical protein